MLIGLGDRGRGGPAGADDSDAADGRGVQRRGRRRGGARRRLSGVLPGGGAGPWPGDARLRHRRALKRDYRDGKLRWKHHRFHQTPGAGVDGFGDVPFAAGGERRPSSLVFCFSPRTSWRAGSCLSPLVSLYLVLGASLLLGVLFVIPIGGADMPIVISLLNAFTGLAAAASGFVLSNYALIISGTLVGASGTILTRPDVGRLRASAGQDNLRRHRRRGNELGRTARRPGGQRRERLRLVGEYLADDAEKTRDRTRLRPRRRPGPAGPLRDLPWRRWSQRARRSSSASTPWPEGCQDT